VTVTALSRLLVLAATTTLLAGCGGGGDGADGGGSTAAASSTPSVTTVAPSDMTDQQKAPDRLTVEVKIQGGEVTPTNAALQAKVGQPIVIRVDSDAADELHVHSVPEHSFPIEAKPGQQFQFTVDVPGNVDIELHDAGKVVATIQVQQ
jgi:sporulation-control protein spo0M